jgi:alkylation response protein AidB-like acyl-CoA dehydrogenase
MGVNFFNRDERDLKFVLLEQLDLDRLLSYPQNSDFTRDDLVMILDEALKVGREVLGPALQDGDRQGCVYDSGQVSVPESFHECYRVITENGWIGAMANPEFGGQGLPECVGGLVMEVLCGANLSVMGYPGLTMGNGHLIEAYGTDQDRAMFVEKMYTGKWGGTMCLTEPDAGTDVGYLRTKAVPDPTADDPRIYKIEGTKRFISGGKHNLAENIIHLLLARIEGGPEGTKGLSLFIVPEIWVNPDGSLGEPNDVFCAGIEHKMGTNGLATCSLNFGENNGCRGILLGDPHTGMAKMFQMMNEARLATGNQCVALAASAYDTARQYAKERVQGLPFGRRSGPRVPIIQHEDIRRMLMNLKSGTEAMRGLIAEAYYLMDVAEHDPDQEAGKKAKGRLDLLTPLLKGYFPDYSYQLIAEAIQILGGVGFCREFPLEQYARDVKIQSIWEGTNYVQSMDLVGRKMGLAGGAVYQDLIKEVSDLARTVQRMDDLAREGELLQKAVDAVVKIAGSYLGYFGDGRIRLVPLTSTRFLACLTEVVLARTLLKQALLAKEKLGGLAEGSSAAVFYQGKILTAKYFCQTMLPNVLAREISLSMEGTAALDMPEEAF